jgi:hypothetical protein
MARRRREGGMSAAAFGATFSSGARGPAASHRAAYISTHYTLGREGDEWVARMLSSDGARTVSEFRGADRARVAFEARRHWGHFNYSDEAEAFGKIFPPGLSQVRP